MTGFTTASSWSGPSSDPNDEQFGDIVDPVESIREDGSAYDAVIVGEPFDQAVIGRKGAAEGPEVIRETLAGVKTHRFGGNGVGSVGDAGDTFVAGDSSDVMPSSVRELQDRLRIATGAVHDADTFPVFVGGDNSLTVPNCLPLLASGTVGVVTLDAHLDVREPREDATSGTPYRQLFEEGLDAYACVGARHFETSTAYAEYVDSRGGEVITAEDVASDLEGTVRRAIAAMGHVDRIYLSLDVDVLDAAAAPGASAPTPGGLATRECFWLLRRLAVDDRIAGFEVVECAPPLDCDDRTVAAAARAIAHVLSARAGRAVR